MNFDELTQEQRMQAQACKTKEECLAFLKDNQIDLTEEQMEQISNGYGDRETNPALESINRCLQSPNREHYWEFTARPVPEQSSEVYGPIIFMSANTVTSRIGGGSNKLRALN